MNNDIKAMLIQVLRNQLTDLNAVVQYSIVQRDEQRHRGYSLRITQTESLLAAIDPEHPL